MKTLTIHVTPEDAVAYAAASADVQREIDDTLRRKLRETLRQSKTEASPDLLPEDIGPDAAVDKVVELLNSDYWVAKRAAAEALKRFPDHQRVQDAWSIFDVEGRAKIAPGGPSPSRSAEFEWLRNPPESMRGRLVALVGSEVVASGETVEELMESMEGKTFSRTPLVHRVS